MADPQTTLVISGTANSGAATVRRAARRGDRVVFTYRSSEDRAQALLDEHDDADVSARQCDVTDAAETTEVVQSVFEEGPVDALVYTAGIIARSPIAEVDDESWDAHVAVNLTGAFNVLRAAAPRFEEQGSGAIVALSASDAIQRNPDLSAYNATKTGLNALVQEVARELAPSGVRANVVAPGPIRDPSALSEADRRDLEERMPIGRICTPDDVALLALFLCSDEASLVTGAVVPIDGGMGL